MFGNEKPLELTPEAWEQKHIPIAVEEFCAALRQSEDAKLEEVLGSTEYSLKRDLVVASVMSILALVENAAHTPTWDWKVFIARKVNEAVHSGAGDAFRNTSFQATAVLSWLIASADAFIADATRQGKLSEKILSLLPRIRKAS